MNKTIIKVLVAVFVLSWFVLDTATTAIGIIIFHLQELNPILAVFQKNTLLFFTILFFGKLGILTVFVIGIKKLRKKEKFMKAAATILIVINALTVYVVAQNISSIIRAA